MRGFLGDCRHALRLYCRTPGGTLISVLVLAVGMAFVGTFLSLYVDLVLRPHPGFEQSGRLATIWQRNESGFSTAQHELVERLADEMATVDVAAASFLAPTLIGPEREPVIAAMISKEFFPGLRPRLALGRGLEAADHEPGAEPVTVLSYRYWRERFAGDRNVVGIVLEVSRDADNPFAIYRGPPGSGFFGEPIEPEQDSARFRIVGVAAEALAGVPVLGGGSFEPPLWLPLERVWPLFAGVPESLSGSRGAGNYIRRARGASVAAVADEINARYGRPDSTETLNRDASFDAMDGIVGAPEIQQDARRQLELFLAGSLLLALVAAANVSLFSLARAPGRRRELGIRQAVGAPVRRLARQLATEAALIVAVAGILGLMGSVWISLYIRGLATFREAQWRDVTLLDWRVLGLSAAMLLVLTLLVSLAPVLGLKRSRIAATSRQATARASLAQRLAGTAQMAVAGMLAGAAVAFGWHVSLLVFGDPGYELSNRYAIQFSRFSSALPPAGDLSEEARLIERIRQREVLEGIPGIERAAFGGVVPAYPSNPSQTYEIPLPEDPVNTIEVRGAALEREFVDLLGFRLLHGRAPEPFERDVLLVNQTLARALFGRENVVGERIRGGSGESEIIGVLEDLSFEHPAAAVKPWRFSPGGGPTVVIESQLTAAGVQQAIDRMVADGVVDVRIGFIESLESLRKELIAPDRARGFLTIATAVLAVLMTAFGLYGTQRYLVVAGRREYAIRASIGAGPTALGRLVLSQALRLGLPGLAIGGLLAFVVAAWLRGDFVSRDIAPGIVTLTIVAGLAVLVIAGSLGPSREARRCQPAPLLRED